MLTLRLWRYDREGDKNSFNKISFYLREFSFLYINDFQIVLNQSAFRILSSFIKSQREEKQKSMISGQFFLFSNFKLLEIRYWYQLQQETLHNLKIVVREITHACICNLKSILNIDDQQACFSKKDEIWLLVEVSFIFFSWRKTSRLYFFFTVKECK